MKAGMTRICVLGFLLLMLPAPAAQANPTAPPPEFRFNVHTFDPDFCVTNSVDWCQLAEEASTALGDVEFDLFLFDAWNTGCYLAYLSFTWPPEWTLQSFTLCDSVCGTVESFPDHANLYFNASSEEGAVMMGRAVLNVTGLGEMRGQGTVWGCGGGPGEVHEWGLAGIRCGYSTRPCYDEEPCGATFEQDTLRVAMDPGSVFADTILATKWGPYCWLRYDVDQPWLSVTNGGTETEPVLYLTIDSSDLEQGIHEGHLISMGDTGMCMPVLLTVNPVATRQTTWGRLKSSFR